jgi:transposase
MAGFFWYFMRCWNDSEDRVAIVQMNAELRHAQLELLSAQCAPDRIPGAYAAQLALLEEIPGVDWRLAAVIIAELGVDMSVFQTISQLASWAGVCPGNNESAGKRKSSRIAKGNVYLKTALVEAANSATKAKGTSEGQILSSPGAPWVQTRRGRPGP